MVLHAGTVAAISAIVSSVTAAVVRIVTVKGKFRAQAADVLVEAALKERENREDTEAENVDLRTALQAFINAVEYGAGNGGLSPRALVQLNRATYAARRLLRASSPRRRPGPRPVDDDNE